MASNLIVSPAAAQAALANAEECVEFLGRKNRGVDLSTPRNILQEAWGLLSQVSVSGVWDFSEVFEKSRLAMETARDRVLTALSRDVSECAGKLPPHIRKRYEARLRSVLAGVRNDPDQALRDLVDLREQVREAVRVATSPLRATLGDVVKYHVA